MASKNVKVVVEFPEGMRKLTKKQAEQLKSMFRTQLANVVGAEAAESVAFLEFENVTNPPVGSKSAAKKPGSK